VRLEALRKQDKAETAAYLRNVGEFDLKVVPEFLVPSVRHDGRQNYAG
jgi:hypothetical protein